MEHILNIEINDVIKQHAVYGHYQEDLTCVYIGLTNLGTLYEFQDARLNSAWREMTSTNPKILTKLLFLSPDLPKANNFRFDQIRMIKPICNLTGHTMRGNHYAKCRVRCNETGEIFTNASEAARLMAVQASYMYSHLKRIYGYKSVKGFTFSRIDDKGLEIQL